MSSWNSEQNHNGFIASKQSEAGFWRTAVKLYRNDLSFRGFSDLAVVGLLVLAFSADWSVLASFVPSNSKVPQAPTLVFRESQLPPQTLAKATTGLEIQKSLIKVTIDLGEIRQSTSSAGEKLLLAAEAANASRLEKAKTILAGLDDRDPVTAYVLAAVIVQEPGLGKLAEAQRLLRTSTRQGVFSAYTLMGQILFQMLVADEEQALPGSERVIVDDAGITHPVSFEELASAADAWWQRAASYNRPEAQRLAGFSKARGLAGKTDYVGAATYWKLAAASGDPLSQHELAMLLMYATGVQSDVSEAIRLFRLAERTIPIATLQLSAALMPGSLAGDLKSGEEGLQMAEKAVKLFEGKKEAGMAHFVLGTYLTIAAPPVLRDLSRGTDELERSVRLGTITGAYSVAEAYRTGTGKKQDQPCALAFYKTIKRYSKEDVTEKINSLSALLTPNEIARSDDIAFRLIPPAPNWSDFPEDDIGELSGHMPGIKLDKTWHSVCERGATAGP